MPDTSLSGVLLPKCGSEGSPYCVYTVRKYNLLKKTMNMIFTFITHSCNFHSSTYK